MAVHQHPGHGGCHFLCPQAILSKQDGPHKAEHEAKHSHCLRQDLDGVLRLSEARFVVPQPLRDRFATGRNQGFIHHTSQGWVDNRARNEYPEKITAVPHSLHFQFDQLHVLILKAGSWLQRMTQVQHFLRESMFDECG